MTGKVHIYTGDGKGKTTAAFGLALRAAGHGKAVYVGQFLKGRPYGEIAMLADNALIKIEQFGTRDCLTPDTIGSVDVDKAKDGLAQSRRAIASGSYDVVILDEIDIALLFGLLSVKDVLELLDCRPAHVELVMTGRMAPPTLIARADLVTEMKEVKHYFRDGVLARAGIEF